MARGRKSRTFTPDTERTRKSKKGKRNKRNGAQKKAAMDSVMKMRKKGFGRAR